MPTNVIVFRKKLLAYSETFIADQGQNLQRYEASFVGLQTDRSGRSLLENNRIITLSDYTNHIQWAKLSLRLGLGINSAWLTALKKIKPQLIHAHFLNDGLDALPLSKKLGVPLITTLHGHDITKHRSNISFKRGEKYFFHHVDKVIAVSDYIAQHALQKGCPEHKLVRHSIGIDLERFKQSKQETEQPSLLFVGRLAEKKGCTYLLQAMKKLRQQYPELKLTIVGDGGLKTGLQAQALSDDLSVDFVGTESAEQIKKRLTETWLFVAPSITAENGDAEGLGMVFLEAQALKTPVVSFRSGGVVEAVEDEVTGLLCAEKDVDSLAHNIDRLLADRSMRQRMGEQGRRRVEEKFDIRKQCALLESIYDDVIFRD